MRSSCCNFPRPSFQGSHWLQITKFDRRTLLGHITLRYFTSSCQKRDAFRVLTVVIVSHISVYTYKCIHTYGYTYMCDTDTFKHPAKRSPDTRRIWSCTLFGTKVSLLHGARVAVDTSTRSTRMPAGSAPCCNMFKFLKATSPSHFRPMAGMLYFFWNLSWSQCLRRSLDA